MGAPQNTIGVPFKNGGSGQGGSSPVGATRADGLTKLAKSIRQLAPGRTIRMGVKPGHVTLSWMKLVSTPNCIRCEFLTQEIESANCSRDSPMKSKTPKWWPIITELGMSRLGC